MQRPYTEKKCTIYLYQSFTFGLEQSPKWWNMMEQYNPIRKMVAHDFLEFFFLGLIIIILTLTQLCLKMVLTSTGHQMIGEMIIASESPLVFFSSAAFSEKPSPPSPTTITHLLRFINLLSDLTSICLQGSLTKFPSQKCPRWPVSLVSLLV